MRISQVETAVCPDIEYRILPVTSTVLDTGIRPLASILPMSIW